MATNRLIFHPEYLSEVLKYAHHLSPVPVYQSPMIDCSPLLLEDIQPLLLRFETEKKLSVCVVKGRLVSLDIYSTDNGYPFILKNMFWYAHTVDQIQALHEMIARNKD